jgi:hypothetical protein
MPMLMEVLEALACTAEIERKIDNLFRHGPVTERKRIDGAGSFACASAARRQVALAEAARQRQHRIADVEDRGVYG